MLPLLTRLLCLSLLVTKALPSAAVETSKTNITSADVVISKRSKYGGESMELESITSNTCFSNGCGEPSDW